MSNTNPYAGTSADSHLNNNLTTVGGDCYNFGDSPYSPELILSDDIIDLNLIPIPCFNRPPIINNDVLDKPFPSPPPVTTGCYPLRARAQTVSNDDDPAGITAEFVDNPSPGKCFPILDITLNLKPIITDVLGIIVPGGGGGPIAIDEDLGCCCDEFGSWYSTVDGCYSGKLGDCIGQSMPVTADCCSQWGSPGCAVGGIGVRWERYDQICNMCSSGNFDCCMSYMWQKWSSPQTLGIGKVVGLATGGVYNVEITIPEKVAGVDVASGGVTPQATNVMEANGGTCTDTQYWIPGVAKSPNGGGPADSEYPPGFEPQTICPGTWVTVMAVTKPGWTEMSTTMGGLVPEPAGLLFGGFKDSPDSGDNTLRCFFSHPFAHDGNCSG